MSVKGAAASRVCQPWDRLEELPAAIRGRLQPKNVGFVELKLDRC